MTAKEGLALMRVGVDMRIPLPWLLGGFFSGVAALAGMWMQVQSMTEATKELQIVVRSSQQSLIQLTGDLALMKYRLDRLENKGEK